MTDSGRFPIALATAVLGTMVFAQPSWADRHEEGRHEEARFHGDIARFHEHDWALWRGGRWYHASHGGRFGWWWVAGSVWYFYPAPVYPYPDPYEPPVAVIVPQAPATPAPPPPQPQNWYYCDASKGYYPYVPSCAAGWRVVPATPSPTPPMPTPAAPAAAPPPGAPGN